ncbi:MAG: purine-binding chemotaxis protein CheW [Paraglaciecola sp.]|jgi:purine-binding chemotaxis protein CheW
MNESKFARQKVMEDYLSALLTDDQPTPGAKIPLDNVSKLLNAALLEIHQDVDSHPGPVVSLPEITEITPPAEKEEGAAHPPSDQPSGVYHCEFQGLIFEVAGLTLALPLTELGGIHQLGTVNPLFGKPDWFKGVMLHREEKINVVDTALWVMPEKCAEKLAASTKYQYLIMLGDSTWGLACESLVNTVILQPEDVKWRKFDGKRTWISGMVKKKMCALVNVKQLIRLLDNGIYSNNSSFK